MEDSKKDVLILISYSGKSDELKNIIQYANRNKILLIGIMSKKIGSSIEKYKFREASQNLMQIARIGNKYLAENLGSGPK